MKLRFSYSVDDSYISISKGEADPVVFDISDPDDESLFAEVLFVLNMASNRVDFFSFHFQSLSNLYAKYGNSEEYDCAVAMVDAVIAHITEVYGEKAKYLRTILYFADNYRTQEVQVAIESVVKDYVVVPNGLMPFSSIVNFLPHIYLTKNGLQKEHDICEALVKALSNVNVDVICGDHDPLKRYISQTPQPQPPSSHNNTNSNNTETVAQKQAELELTHIALWMLLFTICGLLQSCFLLATVEVPEIRDQEKEFGSKKVQ